MRLFSQDPDTPRVLVVEDEAVTAELLKLILLEAGYEVEHVAEGVAARARIEQGGLDLVLLDLSLPGIDGLELCRQIRTAAALDDIHLPILMVTARVSVRERCAG